jgi:DNA-3-methyladenine glycosylase
MPVPDTLRDAMAAAPALLGWELAVREPDGAVLRARIVETEAYTQDDPASHSAPGPTPRNAAMFGPAGHAYVYRIYGVHWCLNVVTGPEGRGEAVLIRALEPLAGQEVMVGRRGLAEPGSLCAGPGRLTQALGIDGADNGAWLFGGGRLTLHPAPLRAGESVLVGPRIGITKAADWPRRFLIAGSPWVSRGMRGAR